MCVYMSFLIIHSHVKHRNIVSLILRYVFFFLCLFRTNFTVFELLICIYIKWCVLSLTTICRDVFYVQRCAWCQRRELF